MRCRGSALTVAAAVLVSALVRAQDAERPETPPIFRLTVALVQLDAVVTDRQGRHVETLGPTDFIVLQDGRPQQVVAVAYVRADEQFVGTGAASSTMPRRPRDARRIVAVVVDDLSMSFASVARTRTALARMISRLLPADLVGLVTTSGARGTTLPLTFGRAELRAAANRLRFSFLNRSDDEVDPFSGPLGLLPSPEEAHRERVFAMAALNRISALIDDVRELPGRKTIVLVSEGFALYSLGPENTFIGDAMRSLVDRANRAGVVIYAVDPRGLVVAGLPVADSAGGMPNAIAMAAQQRAALRATQDGLEFVARQTGGFAAVNSNDMSGALDRFMDDQRGYYLVGYQPEASTFGPGSDRVFRKLKVKVARPGLKIRTRTGFYGIPTETHAGAPPPW